MHSDICHVYIVQLELFIKYIINSLMRKTDSNLVFGYSPKVKKACFPTLIFIYSLELHKEGGLLHQMILTLQWASKEQKQRNIVSCVQERETRIVFNFRMALGENIFFFVTD